MLCTLCTFYILIILICWSHNLWKENKKQWFSILFPTVYIQAVWVWVECYELVPGLDTDPTWTWRCRGACKFVWVTDYVCVVCISLRLFLLAECEVLYCEGSISRPSTAQETSLDKHTPLTELHMCVFNTEKEKRRNWVWNYSATCFECLLLSWKIKACFCWLPWSKLCYYKILQKKLLNGSLGVNLLVLFQCDEQEITRFDKCNFLQRGSYLSKVTMRETQCGSCCFLLSLSLSPVTSTQEQQPAKL